MAGDDEDGGGEEREESQGAGAGSGEAERRAERGIKQREGREEPWEKVGLKVARCHLSLLLLTCLWLGRSRAGQVVASRWGQGEAREVVLGLGSSRQRERAREREVARV